MQLLKTFGNIIFYISNVKTERKLTKSQWSGYNQFLKSIVMYFVTFLYDPLVNLQGEGEL